MSLQGSESSPEPPVHWKRAASRTLHELRKESLLADALVILMGSHARSSATPASDVDILAVVPEPPDCRLHAEPAVELRFITPEALERRILDGDDFAQWAVRHGIPLHDPHGRWPHLRQLLERAPWPDWRRKLLPARHRLAMARGLLETDDPTASAEELKLALSHIARAILLRRGTWPLSRGELPGQLDQARKRGLGRALAELIVTDPTGRRLQELIRRVAEALAELGESAADSETDVQIRGRK